MALAFKNAAGKYKDVGIQLSIAMGNTVLRDKADAFKEKAIVFYNDAVGFNKLAQAVNKPDGLDGIKTYFKTSPNTNLAPKFEEAANSLHNAFNTFTTALESNRTCDTVKNQVQPFQTNAGNSDGFLQKATDFNSQVSTDLNASTLGGLSTNNPQAKEALEKFRSAATKFQQAADNLNDFAAELVKVKDKFEAAAAKFADSVQEFKVAAKDFQTKANTFQGASQNDQLVTKFKTAASAFANAGDKFKVISDELEKFVRTAGCYTSNGLQTQVDNFKTAAAGSNGFQYYANQFKTRADAITSPTNADNVTTAITAFKDAAGKFGSQNDNEGNGNTTAVKFKAFADQLGSINCNAKLSGLSGKFTAAAGTSGFLRDANEFDKAAQLVNPSSGASLEGIKAQFNTAAGSFNTAVENLFNNIKTILQ